MGREMYMTSPRIISIDGISNAGKTTLCEGLAKNVGNIIYIPGVSEFAKMHRDKYPEIPPIPKTSEEEIKNQIFFFEIEAHRLLEANKLLKENPNSTIIMDRTVLEILSVAYSMAKIHNNEEWKKVYKNALICLNKYKQKCNEYGILNPGKSILLLASPEIVKKRNKERERIRGKKLSDNWVDEELLKWQIEYFNRNSYFNETQIRKTYRIDTNNMTKKEVREKVCKILEIKEKDRLGERDD